MPLALQHATDALAGHGLILRGGFAFGAGEAAPDGPDGQPARAVLLIGHGGGTIWPHFSAWRDRQPADLKNPLDTWSREMIGAVADGIGARAVFPSDRPYLPFQQWAMRAEGLKPSPLGILMHSRFGLWHAYRGALLFSGVPALAEAEKTIHACDLCDGKPCLNACPVDAFSPEGFEVDLCRAWLDGPEGADCLSCGCKARLACPLGVEYRYDPAQTAFHMAAFHRAQKI